MRKLLDLKTLVFVFIFFSLQRFSHAASTTSDSFLGFETIAAERPSCADHAQQKISKFRTEFEALEKRLPSEFGDNKFEIEVSAAKRSNNSVKNCLKSCQSNNPDYDFTADIAKQTQALKDF